MTERERERERETERHTEGQTNGRKDVGRDNCPDYRRTKLTREKDTHTEKERQIH